MNIELNTANISEYTEEYFLNLLKTYDSINVTSILYNNDIELTNLIKNICISENLFFNDTKTIKYFTFDFKHLSINQKIEIFKVWLSIYDLVNPYIILNILALIRAYNDFSEDFFNSPQIYFNDITEFLDIKLELKDDIDKFINEFAIWYFSLFRSLHKLEFNFLDSVKKLPLIFEKIITTVDYITLSGIIAKSNISKINELFLVENALFYITTLSQKMNISSELFNLYEQT